MAATTSPQELMRLAYVLNREAARLDAVRDELHQMVQASRGEWEGTVADRFRVHAGAEHRQHHLEVARDRLRHAARLVMDAANDKPPVNHTDGGRPSDKSSDKPSEKPSGKPSGKSGGKSGGASGSVSGGGAG